MLKRLQKLRKYADVLQNKRRLITKKVIQYVDRKPLKSFFIALGIVLALIVISNSIPKQKQEITAPNVVKKVDVYRIGSAPKITVQAQIRKTGVVQIVAQTSGIINMIHAFEGTKVGKGAPLINISSNYYGGNAASLQRQIAQKQDENMQKTYDQQKDIIQKQKDLAGKTDDNSDQLRDITAQSKDETQNLINLNQQIIDALDVTINDPATSTSNLATARQTKSSYLSAINQAKTALRSANYQSASDKPPAQLSDTTREIAIKQLELQEKQLALNKEITHLQFLLAQVTEGMYYPSAPFSGVVERVYVKPFDTVTPGTPLMVISQTESDSDPITAVAFVSKNIANNASRLEESILHIENETIKATPSYVSTEAIQGGLYAVYFSIPDTLNKKLTQDGYITIDIPIGHADTSSISPFIPIDAVYQTRTNAYIFVNDHGVAKSREVTLGQVFGKFVAVDSGVNDKDAVIVNRNVIEDDKVAEN